jgi:hypothetical protein
VDLGITVGDEMIKLWVLVAWMVLPAGTTVNVKVDKVVFDTKVECDAAGKEEMARALYRMQQSSRPQPLMGYECKFIEG